MLLRDFVEQSVSDAVVFHDQLNPSFWKDGKIIPLVRYKLMQIAMDFINFIGIKKLNLTDVIVTGSNASYNYTKHSDIDLHLVVIMDDDDVLKQLFDAKKGLWNQQHDVVIKGHDIEVYVQDAKEPHVSSGMYSIIKDEWIKEPKPIRPKINDMSVEKKYHQYHTAILNAAESGDIKELEKIKGDIKKMRQSGLQKEGEFSAENLAFKMLRNLGDMERLINAIADYRDRELGLKEISKGLDKQTPSVATLAKKYGTSITHIETELKQGIQVEMEHTNDPKIAREIALDHLGEDLYYYKKLSKIEKQPKKE